jgi:hypothetical protein
MKTVNAAVFASALLLAGASTARAAATRDVETDHIDATDDRGPRTFALLVNPLELAFGEMGVEADLALGEDAAASLQGSVYSVGPTSAWAATLGLPFFPQRLAFHGFYLHPRFSIATATTLGSSAQVLGAGGTAGYEWTWTWGGTLRLGGGASWWTTFAGDATGLTLSGVRPELDASIGWVF